MGVRLCSLGVTYVTSLPAATITANKTSCVYVCVYIKIISYMYVRTYVGVPACTGGFVVNESHLFQKTTECSAIKVFT